MIAQRVFFLSIVFSVISLHSMEINKPDLSSLSQDVAYNQIQPFLSFQEISHLKRASRGCNLLYDAEKVCSFFDQLHCSTHACCNLAKNYYTCTKALVHFAHKKDENKFRHLWEHHKEIREHDVAAILGRSTFDIQDRMKAYRKCYDRTKNICQHVVDDGERLLMNANIAHAQMIFSCGSLNIFDLLENSHLKEDLEGFNVCIENIFCQACMSGRVKIIKILCGGSVDDRSLEFIMKYSSPHLIINLIGKDIMPVDSVDKLKKSLLHYAAEYGYHQVIKKALEQGAYVNCTDAKGMTPLHYAIKNSKIRAVSSLLSNEDADVRFINKKGKKTVDYGRNSRFDKPEIKNNKNLIRTLVWSRVQKNSHAHSYGKVHSNGYQKLP